MGETLSGNLVPAPDGGGVPAYAWPQAVCALDANGKLQIVGCSAPVQASSTITGNAPANNETVVIKGKTYTYKTAGALTPAEGEVSLGANETAALLNLKNAINGTGGTNGTDYQVAAPNPWVEATASDATTVTIKARVAGAAGNNITTTATGGITVTGAVLAGGKNPYLYTTAGP